MTMNDKLGFNKDDLVIVVAIIVVILIVYGVGKLLLTH